MKISLFGTGKSAPIYQGVILFICSTLLGSGARIYGSDRELVFIFISAPLFLYCFVNPAVGGFAKSIGSYLLASLVVFVLLMGGSFLVFQTLTGTSPLSTNSMFLMYLLMIVFFFLAHSLGILFRGIRSFLESADQIR